MTKSTQLENAEAVWTSALRQRRAALPQRVGMGVAVALVISPLVGWMGCLSWVAAYIAIQLLEQVVFRPAAISDPQVLPRWRKALGLATVSLGALFFGSLSVPMWMIGGAAGAILAALIIPAALLFVMINTRRSKAILIANVAPYFLYLAAIPISTAAYEAPTTLVIGATASVAAFFLYIVLGWRKMSEAIEEGLVAKAEADRLRLKAERDLAAHTAFLAAVGHDLRTPIGAILTGAADIQNHDAQTRANVDLITDAGLMMKALLDDLLDHSKIGAGRMTVEAVDFDLRKLLAQTIRLWRGPIEAKGLKLRLQSAGRIPRAVRGDPMRLRQVLNNLLSNAVKFTETGAITLRLDAWSEEPGGHLMLLEVADTGPGMSAAQLGRLFTPFDQTQDGVSARHGGTGLGLAISRNLVELMGGRLTARSAPGQGAQFTVSLFFADRNRRRPGAGAAGSLGRKPAGGRARPDRAQPTDNPAPRTRARNPESDGGRHAPGRASRRSGPRSGRRGPGTAAAAAGSGRSRHQPPRGAADPAAAGLRDHHGRRRRDRPAALRRGGFRRHFHGRSYARAGRPRDDAPPAGRRRSQRLHARHRRDGRYGAGGHRRLPGRRHGLFRLQTPDAAGPVGRAAARPVRDGRSGGRRSGLSPHRRRQARGEIRIAQRAFPHDQNAPARLGQVGRVPGVAGAVALDLGDPVVGVGLGLSRAARAVVAVPEAAVDEQGRTSPLHHHVGPTRQAAAAQPIADPGRAQESAHGQFRRRIAALHATHDGAALLGAEDVRTHLLSVQATASPPAPGPTQIKAAPAGVRPRRP
ncbi:signal transduction histidine kinase [Brevundimonas sp. SORGH_AS 993]|nr:signal transduction histidine kinase [Brevundimonas sp. SORGH_AS_0993]